MVPPKSSLGCTPQPAMGAQPPIELVNPVIGGVVVMLHTPSMAPTVEYMKFRLIPGREQLPIELVRDGPGEPIVRRDGQEHRRHLFRQSLRGCPKIPAIDRGREQRWRARGGKRPHDTDRNLCAGGK